MFIKGNTMKIRTALDLRFLKSSSIIAVGIGLARLTGFGFSLVLARLLSPDDYGFIQYNITMAGIVALLTMPFGQHVMARFIGGSKDDESNLNQFLEASWMILIGLLAVTLVVSIPVLALMGKLNIGVIAVFLGMTFHYAYYGLARGFMADYRLLIAYLGSNVVQLIAIILLYFVFQERTAMPALVVYGASYLVPIVILQLIQPFPLRFRLFMPDRTFVKRILRFSAPIWVSHIGYVFYAGVDVLLIAQFLDNRSVGVYTLTKTLTMLLSFVPLGITTVLLPKVAASRDQSHMSLLRTTVGITLGVNAIILLVMVLTYNWFIGTVFSQEYIVPLAVLLMLAFTEICFGIHAIASAILLGKDKPHWESISRIVVVILSITLGIVLIPRFGLTGAALTLLIGGISANLTYVVLWLMKREYTHAVVEVH